MRIIKDSINKAKVLIKDARNTWDESRIQTRLLLNASSDICKSLDSDIQYFYQHLNKRNSGGVGGSFDDFYSSDLGIGTSEDKRNKFAYATPLRLPLFVIDGLYHSSGLIKKVMDIPSKDMLRQGYELEFKTESNEDMACDIISFLNDDNGLNLDAKLRLALPWARGFRQSAIILEVGDGRETWEPVDINQIKSLNARHVVDCGFLSPNLSLNDNIYAPSLYRVNYSSENILIHRDRLLIFDGLDGGLRNRIEMGGYPESYIDYIYQPFQDLTIDLHLVSTIMKDFTKKYYKFANFTDRVRTGTAIDTIKEKLAIMKKLLSVVNGVVMDANDDMIQQTTPVTGIDKMLELIKWHFCINSGIPHTKLFGESPGASLGESGGSQNRDWYDNIKDMQINELQPNLTKIIRYYCAMVGIKETPTIEFCSLWQETSQEKATVEKTEAETEKIKAETEVIWLNARIKTAEQIAKDNGIEYNKPEEVVIPTQQAIVNNQEGESNESESA